MSVRYGMIHGRFQPFHLGHMEYLQAALERCQTLIVAITNPDPESIREEMTSGHRHRPEANRFTFFQRLTMIREAVLAEGIPLSRLIFIPFPINIPDRWHYYIPKEVVQFIRVFSEWEETKAERFRQQGYRVEIVHPGIAKAIAGSEIRRRLDNGEEWEELVPPAVARVIKQVAAGEL
ncbi:MAG: adenylyltransferase/cytidyltransferase family protein [Dehalococcoidia bacterium]